VKNNPRLDQVVNLVNEAGFLSVGDLSRLCDVSEMTIRRDLELLHQQQRIRRTYGGAVSLSIATDVESKPEDSETDLDNVLLVDKVDVLIGTSVNPYYDDLLIERLKKKNIPLIAESIEMPDQTAIVAVDNYQAGYDLGLWAGDYMNERGVEQVNLLDLTFHQPNTQLRSHGFLDGLRKSFPTCETILSINSQSRYATAYQLVNDALSVYPQINLIFAINDTTAWGAINACRDRKIDPAKMTVIAFGLEGDTLKNELIEPDSYCKAALAMFPEVVSMTCLEAAIASYNHEQQPVKFITPHIVLTAATLSQFYIRMTDGWKLNWETVKGKLRLPFQINHEQTLSNKKLPRQIGLIVPFTEHEWYKNLTRLLNENAKQYGINLQVIDADQNVRDEVEIRRHLIARKAASLINSGDVVLVDGGPISKYLAEELKLKQEITVITNSITVFDVLNRTPGIVLISTGGAARFSTQILVGPTTENALKELRADKLFLMVSGISLDFGLSQFTISEVTVKQAMIRSAREVIVLADHTAFGAEVGIQVAPLTAMHKLITDDALPPSVRLDISKLGIQIILAS
jgi:DeoR/GlpR family transcriptional regulator of sugar metabolism